MDQATAFFLYMKVFPYTAVMSIMIFIYFLVFGPHSLKSLIKSWLTRRPGAIMLLCNDEGGAVFDFMRGDMGQGIYTGNLANYIFTPRPTSVVKDDMLQLRNKPTDPEEDKPRITDDEKETMNHIVLHRTFTDLNKPLFVGYISKSVAVPPRVLHALSKLNKKAEELPTYMVDLADPKMLKTYITQTFSPALLDAITWKSEQKGYFSRPLDNVKKNMGPIGLILIIGALAYLISTGQLNIPGLTT
jgi:hypothetical protein